MEYRYGLMRVNNDLMVDQSETTVAEWLGYILSVCDSDVFRSFGKIGKLSDKDKKWLLDFKYPDSLLPAKNMLQQLEWHELLKNEKGYRLKYVDCSNSPQSVPVNSTYFANDETQKRLTYLLELPITGITYDQALGYCKWRTKMDSLQYPWEDFGYYYRLPTIREFDLMNEELDSAASHTKREKQLYGFNYRDAIGDSSNSDSIGKNLTSVWKFHYSKLGLYDIQGNAAEMTSERGVAYGGSYFQYASESLKGKSQNYDSAQAWLGMRCVAVRNAKDTFQSYYNPGNYGVLLGYEGWHTSMFEVGIGLNPFETWFDDGSSSFFGYSLSFKKSLSSRYWGINNDLWLALPGFALGLNYNYNYSQGKTNHGIKPFIGVSYHNITLCYGYNFHGKTTIEEINNHQLTLRYYLPLIRNKRLPM